MRRMAMCLVLLASSLAGCLSSNDRTPAWPTRTEPEVDGGESLAPRAPSVVAASTSTDDDDETTDEATPEAKPVETKAADKPAAAATPATTAPDEVINIDDIVIEIED